MAKFDKYFALRALASLIFLVSAIVLFVSNDYTANDPNVEPHSPTTEPGAATTITSLEWPGLWYCLIVYCIGFAYNGVVLLVPHGSSKWNTVVIFDVITNLVMAVSVGVGWEIQTLTSNGYLPGRYYPLCPRVEIFCSRLLVSQVMATIGFGCTFSLSMYTLFVLVESSK